jgi:hypothetical protein
VTVTGKEKMISRITAISMAGDVVMPLLVILRKAIDPAVWEEAEATDKISMRHGLSSRSF